uniref:Uncharacterized protein n=1 Tax=Cacopsylla melanoneura TaxID=428564 RepID=A0A8D8SWS4_9HEMI
MASFLILFFLFISSSTLRLMSSFLILFFLVISTSTLLLMTSILIDRLFRIQYSGTCVARHVNMPPNIRSVRKNAVSDAYVYSYRLTLITCTYLYQNMSDGVIVRR